MKNINDLRAAITKREGLARPNRFRIVISGQDAIVGKEVSYFCDSVNMPGRQITTSDHSTGMKSYKRPYAYINDDVTMTFLVTNDFLQWKYFKDWTDQIISSNHEISYKTDYIREVSIYTMDINDKVTRGIKLTNAFPVTMNSIELSSESENTTTKLTVMLTYDDWTDINLGS